MELDTQQSHFAVDVSTNGAIKVNIPPGTNLNGFGSFPEQEELEQHSYKQFSEDVYTNLPDLLRLPCQKVIDPNEREILFVGLLGVVSGILPNVEGYYGGKKFQPNLYTYTIGPYGEGKSGLMWARKIAEPIHLEKYEKSKELRKEYRDEMALCKKAGRLFEQGKADSMPEQPSPPPHLKLFMPANNGKTGVLQLLLENNGRGILFETEADTLVEAMKQEHGGFSDVLRQAFGHEPLSYFRRTNNEDVEIPSPALSVVLSSTADQFLRLIPTSENGLFSRFIYYEFRASPEFNDVFDSNKNSYNSYFSDMGTHFKKLYDDLAALQESILFELQPQQKNEFLKYFKELKLELCEYISSDLGGTVNRLGLICFRIAMQLSVCRTYEKGYLPLTLQCTDQDFDNALRISRTLLKHTIAMYDKLPKPRKPFVDLGQDKLATIIQQKNECFALFNSGVTNVREIAKRVLGSESKKSTVHRWIRGY